MKDFKLIIAGGRDFEDYSLMKKEVLETIKDIQTYHDEGLNYIIISGGARGADKLGEEFARQAGFECEVFPAKWNEFGRSAGFIRNNEMAEAADGLIAFWDGVSRGTSHMINQMVRMKKVVYVSDY